MYSSHIARTILNYLPKNKIKHGRNFIGDENGHIKNKSGEIMCELPGTGLAPERTILHFLSVIFGNTQMVILMRTSIYKTQHIHIYFIKRNFKKKTGIDNYAKRQMYYYKKCNRLRRLIDSLKYNISLFYPMLSYSGKFLDSHPYSKKSRSGLSQIINYIFIVEIC